MTRMHAEWVQRQQRRCTRALRCPPTGAMCGSSCDPRRYPRSAPQAYAHLIRAATSAEIALAVTHRPTGSATGSTATARHPLSTRPFAWPRLPFALPLAHRTQPASTPRLRYACRHEHAPRLRPPHDLLGALDPHARRRGAPGRHRGGAASQRRRHAGAADAPCATRRRHPQRRQRLPRRAARCRRCPRLRAVQRAGRCAGQRAPRPAFGRAGLLVCGTARMFRGSRAAVCRGTGPVAPGRGAAGADRYAARRAQPARADDGLDLPALRHPPGGRPHRLPGPLAHAAGGAQALRHALLRHRGTRAAGGQPGRP